MLGIAQIATYIPSSRIDLLSQAEMYETTPEFLTNKSGFVEVARKASDEDTSDMCVAAYNRLRETSSHDLSAIDCIIVCTQNPDGRGLPHTSAILHGKLGLAEHVAAFDVSLGCSGYVYCLSIAISFMQSNNLKKGILFTADPYSKIIAPMDKATSLLFGDGASATLIASDPDFIVTKTKFATIGQGRSALEIGSDGYLKMNGRAVYAFSATKVPSLIEDLLRECGYSSKDIDLFLLHQGSRYIIDTLRQKLKVDESTLPFLAAETGNLVSSSIPFLLAASYTRIQRRALLCGFGVGLSLGACVIEKCVPTRPST